MTHVWLLSSVFMLREHGEWSVFAIINKYTYKEDGVLWCELVNPCQEVREGSLSNDSFLRLEIHCLPSGTFCHPQKAEEKQGNYSSVQADWLHRAVLSHFVLIGRPALELLGDIWGSPTSSPFQTGFPLGITHHPPFSCGHCKFLLGEQQLLWITHYLNKPVWD